MSGEIANIQDDEPSQGKLGIPCDRVLKRGAKTGLTFGVTNSVEACVRTKGAHGSWSRQILVVPFPNQVFRISGYGGHCCFSHAGDSGAAVVDPTGMFIGQVVAGSGPPIGVKDPDPPGPSECQAAPLDLTFVLPAGSLIADMKRRLRKKLTLLRE
ncbi:hypothetical protein PG984_010373 [Apiospora sp. TS-2023a]